MIRIGLIGTESSHTDSILRRLAELDDVEVTAVFGDEPNDTKRKMTEFGLDCEVFSVEEMIGKVDGVMVTMRDGAEHLAALRPLFGHNIAMWVDKPFTASVEDAEELVALIKKHNTPFSGGSFIKMTEGVQAVKKEYNRIKDNCMSAYMSFWTKLESKYSGMHFYSHHLIESVLEAFGLEIRAVNAKRKGDCLVVTAEYDNFYVLMNYAVNAEPVHAGVFGKDSSLMCEVSFGNAENEQVDEFVEVIKTGKSPYPPEFFLAAVKVSNAIEESMKTGKEVKIS